jgi:hypothetical protein
MHEATGIAAKLMPVLIVRASVRSIVSPRCGVMSEEVALPIVSYDDLVARGAERRKRLANQRSPEFAAWMKQYLVDLANTPMTSADEYLKSRSQNHSEACIVPAPQQRLT